MTAREMEVRNMKRYIKSTILILCLAALAVGAVAEKNTDDEQPLDAAFAPAAQTSDSRTMGDDGMYPWRTGLSATQGAGDSYGEGLTGWEAGRKTRKPRTGAETAVDYIQVAEDIEIMAKIIDKSLGAKFSNEYKTASMFRESRGCQGIYLKGYGAVFMTNIGFPVSERDAPEPKAVSDDLWQRTRDELKGVRVINSYGISFYDKNTGGSYDAGKVQKLKKELLQLVGTYAANIRHLGSQENVVVAVRGWSGSVKRVQTVVYDKKNDVRVVQLNTNDLYVKPGSAIFAKPAIPVESAPAESKDESESAKQPTEPTEPSSLLGVAATPAEPEVLNALPGEYSDLMGAIAAPRVSSRTVTAFVTKPDGSRYTMLMSDGKDSSRTTLIIRVSKGSIMSYKDGKLDLEELMKESEIVQY